MITSLLTQSNRVFLFALAIPVFAGSSAAGIKNFHQLNEHVYRGAQPTDEGLPTPGEDRRENGDRFARGG